MSFYQNLKDYILFNATQTKGEVAIKEQNLTVNGILWNAFDTYQSVIFNKKLILNSKDKSNLDRPNILSTLENHGLTSSLFKQILFDLWFGGGAGIVIYNQSDQLEYISAYKPISYNCNTFDYKKSRTLNFENNQILYYKNIIQGSYFLIRKDYDNFNNFYSVLDKSYVQIQTYNQISRYNLAKSSKNFEREMFYQISSDSLIKIGENDSDAERIKKEELNKNLFQNIKERVTNLFSSISNTPKIIQSAITPIFVDSEVDLDKLVKFKDSIIKEIALAANVPASSLGISNSANKAQSETDRDNLTNQATIYTNIFVACANYWLYTFYPDLEGDLYFTWQENETDETLAIREQNQKVLEFYTTNALNFQSLGIEADVSKLVELANSVSIPDLFKLKEKISESAVNLETRIVSEQYNDNQRTDDQELFDQVFKKYHETVNISYSELVAWDKNPISKLASLGRSPIRRNLELLNTKKENWTQKHIKWANWTISFVARMKANKQGKNEVLGGKDTGWSGRDISLVNWAYNPKKNQAGKTREFDTSKLKTLNIDEYESLENIKNIQEEINQRVKKYIRKSIESKNKNRADETLSDYLPGAYFEDSLKGLTDVLVGLYNDKYLTNFSKIEAIDNYINDVTRLTYKGDNKGYKGLQNTIDKEINNGRSYEQVVKSTLQSINGNLYTNLFNTTFESISVADGANYIATSAKNDSLVRPFHLASQGIIWLVGDIRNYWLEPNCRCSRFYGTLRELIDAGFINSNNYVI